METIMNTDIKSNVDRICISINNKCNLNCAYCHFHEKNNVIKEKEMNIIDILDNVVKYIDKNNIGIFKIGFVGNGEPLLEYEKLKLYIEYISKYISEGRISVYCITNGLLVDEDKLDFFRRNKINLGFSIDGIQAIHDKYRCRTFSKVMDKIKFYHSVMGKYPSMNCTVGKEILEHADETIEFFKKFDNRITFSRMIGRYGISLEEFRVFLKYAEKSLNVRRGGYDCTMYGGLCGAGMNNFFYSNGYVYLCGNCIDLPPLGTSDIDISELEKISLDFDREFCYKESICV